MTRAKMTIRPVEEHDTGFELVLITFSLLAFIYLFISSLKKNVCIYNTHHHVKGRDHEISNHCKVTIETNVKTSK